MVLMFLILTMIAMVFFIFAFVAMIVRAARREVHLCAAYMKQMEKTSQAERKSMKQSLAFASANHDVRGYLACMKSLIELCYNDVSPSSELASNLRKMKACVEDLLALVNSILDFSKIEAGKMQLEEKEFNLAQLLEDTVDLHHPVAMKKGVEVILDPCDGSIMKFCHVKGDQGKLKQILSNLLSNAVKFTSQGHIIIRAWAKKKHSLENSILASNKNCLLNRLSRLFYKNKKAYNEVEEMKTIKQDPNCMEFEFEVEDTGLGIPKDKQQSIFENFVQVKENSIGQVGTGLGLGIVQSLVRMMGGDIEIVDKANKKRGSCFKFNIFLISQDVNNEPIDNPRPDKRENTYPVPKLNICARSPGVEGSIVVLLINNDERRKMIQRYLESLGIKSVVVRQATQLSHTLKRKVQTKINALERSVSPWQGNLSTAYSSCNLEESRPGSKILPIRKMGGVDDKFPAYKKPNIQRSFKCILLIIDANAGDFQELCRSVAEFRKDQCRTIKVVWLEMPENRKVHFPGLEDDSFPPTDFIVSEPFHGSRLMRVIGLLPEFGGELLRVPNMRKISKTSLPRNLQIYTEEVDRLSTDQGPSLRKRNLQFNNNDDAQKVVAHKYESLNIVRSMSRKEFSHEKTGENLNEGSGKNKAFTNNKDGSSFKKPLIGKKILVAGNDELMKFSSWLLKNLGGVVNICQNGKKAVEIVRKALHDQNPQPLKLPYDYILMDTKMEDMNGYNATKLIRIEESKYGIHIPILGLIHEPSSAEMQRIVKFGMDFPLTAPFTNDAILEAIRSAERKSFTSSQASDVQYTVGGASFQNPLNGKKFILVEDLSILRMVSTSFLSRLGAAVEACENGKEVVDLIYKALGNLTGEEHSEFPYDYVLMDCQMPIMDGFEATKKIRQEERKYNIHIPVIALTAGEGEEDGKKITEAGMDFHLTKPLKKDELLETLRLIHERMSYVKN